MKVVFLDRDGVINEFPGNGLYVTRVRGFHFIPRSLEALKLLTEAGYHIFVISNQAGVGKGLYSKGKLEQITERMLKQVKEAGARIDEVYYCTCRSSDGCHCRKPRIGNVIKALKLLDKTIDDARHTYFVGDTEGDIKAGKNAGCKTIFALSGREDRAYMKRWDVRPDYIVEDLYDAAKLILEKILILHATAGAGHRKAAEAVFHGLKARGIPADIVDALDYTNPFFKKAYVQGYEFMVGKLPKLWAVFFELTDQKWFLPIFKFTRRIYNHVNSGPLVRFIKDGNYDVVVTTHFLSTEVCGWLRRTGQIESKFVTIVTDYDVHRIWCVEGVDVFLVASDFTKRKIVSLGVDEKKVFVTGIPVDEKFIQPRNKQEIRRKLGIREDKFTVLLSTSSFGFGPIEEIAELLKDVQLIIICGNNKTLFEKMLSKGNSLHKICGFVDNMEEMMAASDVMVTKPGGLSVSEALANNLPLVFFSAIPGQEAGNVRVLAEHGIGMSDKSIAEIAEAMKRYDASPEALHSAREATKVLARPHSVEDIIKHLA